jgi:hypothetical protein
VNEENKRENVRMKYRQEADYNPSYMFTPEDFIEFRKDAEGVILKMTSRLKQEAYLSEDLHVTN